MAQTLTGGRLTACYMLRDDLARLALVPNRSTNDSVLAGLELRFGAELAIVVRIMFHGFHRNVDNAPTEDKEVWWWRKNEDLDEVWLRCWATAVDAMMMRDDCNCAQDDIAYRSCTDCSADRPLPADHDDAAYGFGRDGFESQSSTAKYDAPVENELVMLGVHDIEDNPFQPRREFSEPEIVSLAESLKEHDMLQPVLVRKVDDRWQLISGERRLRAAIRAGWTQVPARVRLNANDRLVAELAIVENLQRKDLNPIEKALSFRRYLDEHECTQEDLSRRIKIDRSTIANFLRLLELPSQIQTEVSAGKITYGHARAVLPLGDEQEQIAFSKRIQDEGLSVRDTERIVGEKLQEEDALMGISKPKPKKKTRTKTSQIASLEQKIRIALGTKVDIKQTGRGRGQLVIQFRGNDEFERLTELLLECSQENAESFAG